jgi:hypothetical protein
MTSTISLCLLAAVVAMTVRFRTQVKLESEAKLDILKSETSPEILADNEFKTKCSKILNSENVDDEFNKYITALTLKLNKSYKSAKKSLENSYLCFAFSKQELIEKRSSAMYDIQWLEIVLEKTTTLHDQYKKGLVF